MTNNPHQILHLLQLASPALPVGAYSYSEGLETLVERGVIYNQTSLGEWLEQDLCYGAIRLEAAIIRRAYQSFRDHDLMGLSDWNHWLSATKETTELRSQSWQMGSALRRLLLDLQPELEPVMTRVGLPCNYAIAFSIAAGYWQIDLTTTLLGYLQSWACNYIAAGVKLIPLGQTAGQQLLLDLAAKLPEIVQEILTVEDNELGSCSWGLALASMAHETQYTRLFRS